MTSRTFDFKNGEILNFNKPVGKSSFYVIKVVRSIIGLKKIGHAGTLDPFATGVLLLCTGKATKQVSQLMNLPKEYIGKIKLGEVTDTDDLTGKIISNSPVPELDVAELETVCQQFIGEFNQVPPMFSAKRINGKRLYKIARTGETVDRPAKPVTVYSLEIIAFENPFITIKVTCSKGTYIRALARDIGQEISCGAHLHSLTRTKIGNYTIEQALTFEQFKELL